MAKTRSARSTRAPKARPPRSSRKEGAPKASARTKGAATTALNPAAAVQAILDTQSRVAQKVWHSADAIVRQSFKLYERDVELLKDLKKRAGALAVPVKKSELVRAGLKALSDMQEAVFSSALKAIPKIGSAAKAATAGKAGKRAVKRAASRSA